MSEKLEKLLSSIWADDNYEFLDGDEGYTSNEEYNRAINDEYVM